MDGVKTSTKKRKRAGAPGKGTQARSHSVAVRVTAAEFKQLAEDAAKLPGGVSVSSYVRWLIFKPAAPQGE